MTTAATLEVKILADISNFEKNLPKADRVMLKTADNFTAYGKKLSIGVTAPLIALSAVIAKSAADDAASVAKVQRTFGTQASAMESWISQLMKTVPATDDELRGLAVSTDTLLRSMGLAGPAAQSMTQKVTKLAGDLAAYNHVELGVAQDALESALSGKTKSLQQFGVVLSEADIKARAYQLGIARVGAELTHAQTAQAAWSVILDKTKQQQGEAARTIDDSANAIARLKQAADSVGDSFGAVVLPTAAKVVGAVTGVMNSLAALPDSAKGTIVAFGAVAAAAGPAIIAMGSLARNVTLLKGALRALGEGSGMAGLGASLSAVALAAGLVAAPVAAVMYAFSKEGESARRVAGDMDLYKTALDKLSLSQLKAQQAASQGLANTLEKQRTGIAAQITSLPQAGAPGFDVNTTPASARSLAGQLNSVVAQQAAVQSGLSAITAKLTEMNSAAAGSGGGGGAAPSIADQLKDAGDRAQAIISTLAQMKGGWLPIAGITDAWQSSLTDVFAILRKIPDQLSPTAVKAREIATALEDAKNSYDSVASTLQRLQDPDALAKLGLGVQVTTSASTIPKSLSDPKPLISGLSDVQKAMQAGFQQVSVAIGDTLAQNLSALIGGRGIGSQVGGSLGGAFGGGAAAAWIGSKAIGGALGGAMGSVVPVVGTLVGSVIGSAIGGLFGGHKKAADNASASLNTLATTAEKVSAALSNVPQGFKIAYDNYLATKGAPTPRPAGGSPNHPGDPSDPSAPQTAYSVINLHGATFQLVGVSDVKTLWDKLGEFAESQQARGGTTALRLGLA
jgi:hypothetical protein